ncbi:hypothetical protein, partial [Escherichia coli]|uniref:hypothetical protein n=1 Tax=Escherichia coli TaxID=562 RepID=UPI0037DD6DCC
KGWAILLRQKQKKLIMLPSETMIWQPEFTDKTLSRKPGAVQYIILRHPSQPHTKPNAQCIDFKQKKQNRNSTHKNQTI